MVGDGERGSRAVSGDVETGPPGSLDPAFALSNEELADRREFVRGVRVGSSSR